MARDNSNATVDVPEQAAPMAQNYQDTYKGLTQGMNIPQYTGGPIRPFLQPSTLELPLSQVSTGKKNKAGQPSNMKTWVTAELARVVAKAQTQGAVRVSITITPIFE